MSLGDKELEGLNGIVGEFHIGKDVVSNVGTGTASVEVLKRKRLF